MAPVSDDDVADQLGQHALKAAGALGLTVDGAAREAIMQLALKAAMRLREGGQHQAPPGEPMDGAKAAFSLLVAEMVVGPVRVDGGGAARLTDSAIGETAVSAALLRICPLWPICP